jgi:hypothetical protein
VGYHQGEGDNERDGTEFATASHLTVIYGWTVVIFCQTALA